MFFATITTLVVLMSLSTGCARSPGDLAGAPEPVGGRASGPVAVDGSTTTQSFRIDGDDSELAISDYEELASGDGWVTTKGPAPTGDSDWSLTMVKDDTTLAVTASPFDGDIGSEGDAVEISLEITTTS